MIYLDHHAATPIGAGAERAMKEAEHDGWANPSSTHQAGRASRAHLERARDRVAQAIGAAAAEVVLTGGGTEACNLAVLGLGAQADRVITTEVEHPAVGQAVQALGARGIETVRIGCPLGVPPSADELAATIGPDGARCLVALQWVNHETGTLFPVDRYAAVCAASGAQLFIDATQALGKVPIDVHTLNATAIALASQKVGGPSGAGALWLARGVEPARVLQGGQQERGRRPGTLDVVTAAGFGGACQDIDARLSAQKTIAEQRDRLEQGLVSAGGVVNGEGPRVATATNVSFAGWKGSVLTAALDLDGVCVSPGAACSSGLDAPSPVVAAMYSDEQWRAGSAVRSSLGPTTDSTAIDAALLVFQRALARRAAKPHPNSNAPT